LVLKVIQVFGWLKTGVSQCRVKVFSTINKAMPIKKGEMVKVIREKLENSIEAAASDSRFSDYIFKTKGEVVDLRGDYAFVKFGQVPTPNIWLRVDQLEPFS
jgi:hypothetical protein